MELHKLKSGSGGKGPFSSGSSARSSKAAAAIPAAGWNQFFQTPLLSQQLKALLQLVGADKFLGIVIGEKGSGKTTLMRRLMVLDPSPWCKARLAFKFERGTSGRLAGLDRRQVALAKDESRLPAILFDDAQRLSWPELKFLVRCIWPRKGHGRLRGIVFFATPDIRPSSVRMMDLAPTNAFVRQINLNPLTEEQTASYLRHRLSSSEATRPLNLSRRRIKRIYRLSGGLPGLIEKAADEQLIQAGY